MHAHDSKYITIEYALRMSTPSTPSCIEAMVFTLYVLNIKELPGYPIIMHAKDTLSSKLS